ncbi:MAG: hypothetical protein P8K08_18300 [Fuerstiella sp.]|nr:hypothetical protein [Fuerstiella sp.]
MMKFTIAVLTLTICSSMVSACPFCLAPMQTWAEMVADAEVVVLAKLQITHEGSQTEKPYAVLEIVEVHKGRDVLPDGRIVRMNDYLYGQAGDLFLLRGGLRSAEIPSVIETFAQDDANPTSSAIRKISASGTSDSDVSSLRPQTFEWDWADGVSVRSYRYITAAPGPKKETQERLKYFLPFLETEGPLVAADAWGEFANADYEDIVASRKLFPADKLRTWISNKQTSPERLGLYGMMLGVCGSEQDAEFLEQQIGQPVSGEIRFGVEGLMGGLLLLTGEDGLSFLEETRLENANASQFDCFAVVQALQFVWAYEPELMQKQRLRSALYPMLEREDLREIAVRDLARWQDWKAVPLLTEVYEDCRNNDLRTVRAIIGFLFVCLKSEQDGDTHVAAANRLLDRIRSENGRVVRSVERDFR